MFNLRIAFAAQLQGVLNGIFLVALGAVWVKVELLSALKNRVSVRGDAETGGTRTAIDFCARSLSGRSKQFWRQRMIAYRTRNGV